MNIGDKLICKRDFVYLFEDFFEGKEYVISSIVPDYSVGVYIDTHESRIFYLLGSTKRLEDNFYSKEELRLLKLESINL